MPRNCMSADDVRRIVRLRGEGLSFDQIASQMGRSREGVRKAWRRHVEASGQPIPEMTQMPGPPKQRDVDVLVDSSEVDGVVSIVKKGQLFSPHELKEMAGLGEDWLATNHRANSWEVAMKLGGAGDQRVHKEKLWQSATTFRRVIGDEMREAVLDFCQKNVSPLPTPPNRSLPGQRRGPPQVASAGIWDAHVGMYAFGEEVGENYDVNIATARCLNAVDDLVDELALYDIQQVWAPIGNDFLHFDNVRQRTTQGLHDLDADSRFAKAYRAGTEILVYYVQRLADICEDVRVFYVPGNHDVLTSYTLTCMLAQRFRDDPRVSVDLSCNPQKIMRFGGVAVMYEHGKDVAANQFPLIFHEHALGHARDHGIQDAITYKEVQVGHKHQKRVRIYEAEVPTNGVRVVTNPALCNVDFYHHSLGLIGEPMKSVEVYRYDRVGRRGSHVCWARDDER